MELGEIKQKLHSLIDATNDENILVRLLNVVELKSSSKYPNEDEALSREDYDELVSLVNEPPEKDTISYAKLKSSLSRWFTK